MDPKQESPLKSGQRNLQGSGPGLCAGAELQPPEELGRWLQLRLSGRKLSVSQNTQQQVSVLSGCCAESEEMVGARLAPGGDAPGSAAQLNYETCLTTSAAPSSLICHLNEDGSAQLGFHLPCRL